MTPWDSTGAARQFEEPGPWDSCTLANLAVPGIVKVVPRKGRAVEQRDLPGGAGSTTFLTYHPARVDIDIRLWTDDQLKQLKDLLKVLEPAKGESPKPVDIVHPATLLRGIRSIFVMEITGPTPAGDGFWTVSITASEWWPKTKKAAKVSTPTGSQGGGNLADRFKGRTAIEPVPSHAAPPSKTKVGP